LSDVVSTKSADQALEYVVDCAVSAKRSERGQAPSEGAGASEALMHAAGPLLAPEFECEITLFRKSWSLRGHTLWLGVRDDFRNWLLTAA